MKITGLRLRELTGVMEFDGDFWEERLIRPIDVYPEHKAQRASNTTGAPNRIEDGKYRMRSVFLEIDTDEGVTGLGGPVANPYLDGNDAKARDFAGKLAEMFGPERFFIEIQDHGIKEQREVNRKLIPLAKSLGLPIVATNDVHYCNQGDAPYQDVLVCVQTNTTIHDPKRLKQDSNEFFLRRPSVMTETSTGATRI